MTTVPLTTIKGFDKILTVTGKVIYDSLKCVDAHLHT